jgi:3,4-dihydroxy 2-butanone 4-phosphate synthase/GTP cyclohydrolase II
VELSEKYISELFSIKERLKKSLQAFKNGELILVGDDGLRENEVDLVFHAKGSTPQNVNFAITHAKGLLCVSLSHEIANQLGISTAPNLPGGISHTNFTLSVDAKHGITSGISAKDRAHTISLMADPKATTQDFISPGHVFPLRAMNGGLLARAGHTEALYELCRMTNLPYAAAMCEVLGENGEAINPNLFTSDHKYPVFKNIPFISTVDILWNRILFENSNESVFEKNEEFIPSNLREKPIAVYLLIPKLEKSITLTTIITIYNQNITPETTRISITNTAQSWDNSVSLSNCSVSISMFSTGNCLEKTPTCINDFCDMSAKEGLNNTKTSVKRVLSLLRSFQFLTELTKDKFNLAQNINKLNFIVQEDKYFLAALLKCNENHS